MLELEPNIEPIEKYQIIDTPVAIPKMRFAEQAYEDIKKLDPNTGLSLTRIRGWVKSGKIPSFNIGKRRLFNLDDLLNFIASPDVYKN